MRPASTLQTHPAAERPEPSAGLNPTGLLSLSLLTIILFAGPCVLGAVRPWIELPILGGVTVLLLLQAGRLVTRPPLGSLRQIDAIDLSVLLFTAYAILRWLTSPVEFLSRFEVLSVVGYAVIFLYCRHGIGRRKYGVNLLVLLVILGFGEVVFGYLLHLHSNLGDPGGLWFPFGPAEQMQLFWAPRWLGSYGCPNHYACLLVMAACAALALGCFSRFPWPARIVFFYVAALLQVGILYSQSRGSWFSLIGAILALVYFAVRYSALRWWIPAAGGVVLAAILATIFFSSPVAENRVMEMNGTLKAGRLNKYLRVQLTEDALRIAHDHPLFGTGPATYAFEDPRYQVSTLQVKAVFTHDDYLNCLDDYGLVGFFLAMFFVFAVTLTLGTRILLDSRWTERVLVAAGLMIWCALLVHSLLDFNLHIPANAMLLFGITGMALARRPGEDAPYHWSTVSLARLGPALGWGLGVFALVYGAQIVRTTLTDLPYEKAQDDADVSPTIESIRRVNEALFFDPGNAQALVLLGDLRRLRAARAETKDERTTEGGEALVAYQAALKANPLDDTVRAQLGLTYDLLQRYPEALASYQGAVAAQPYSGQFWMVLGNHFFSLGMLDKAEKAYATAANCPRGRDGAEDSAKKVREILALRNFLPSPLEPAPMATPKTVAPAVQAAASTGTPAPSAPVNQSSPPSDSSTSSAPLPAPPERPEPPTQP